MADIIAFRPRIVVEGSEEDGDEIDLRTAVDAAIRDLRDILMKWGDEGSRRQAEECRTMLERALNAGA